MNSKDELDALLARVSGKLDDTIKSIKSKTQSGSMNTLSKSEAAKILANESAGTSPDEVKAALIRANAALDRIKSSIPKD